MGLWWHFEILLLSIPLAAYCIGHCCGAWYRTIWGLRHILFTSYISPDLQILVVVLNIPLILLIVTRLKLRDWLFLTLLGVVYFILKLELSDFFIWHFIFIILGHIKPRMVKHLLCSFTLFWLPTEHWKEEICKTICLCASEVISKILMITCRQTTYFSLNTLFNGQ